MEEKDTVNIEKPVTEEVQAIKTSDFMKETIKQRPINKKKLLRRLFFTIAMAVVFGLVACITFLLLEPVINARINPEKQQEAPQINPVSFVEETAEDEMELAPVII